MAAAAAAAQSSSSRRPSSAIQLLFLILALGAVRRAASDGTFKLLNNCAKTIWVGAMSSAGIQPLSLGNVMLSTGQSLTVSTPNNWGGRFWGRTDCNFGADNIGTCQTGDCGGKLICEGTGGKPPATLVEVTLNGADGKDFYDVSLVDGYNLPLAVEPTSGGQDRNVTDTKSCTSAGCTGDLNQNCPDALRVTGNGGVVGCRSACDKFNDNQYCCTGPNSLPNTCPPTDYSRTFKQSCPKAYSYAYDDNSSLFTCKGGQYTITFCPTSLTEGVQFPEAQPLPGTSAAPGDSSSSSSSSTVDGGAIDGGSSTMGTNFRIITASKGEITAAAPAAWFFVGLVAALQLRPHVF